MAPEAAVERMSKPEERPTLSARERKREQTRDRIYAASMAEFARVGVAKAQISEIARTAGVAYGSFYSYFECKEAVLRESARRLAERIVATLDANASNSYASARQLFDEILRVHTQTEIEVPELRGEVWAAAVRQPRPSEGRHPHLMAIARHVQALQDRGLLRIERSSPEIAAAFLTSILGVMVRSTPGDAAVPEVIDTLIEVFSDSLGT